MLIFALGRKQVAHEGGRRHEARVRHQYDAVACRAVTTLTRFGIGQDSLLQLNFPDCLSYALATYYRPSSTTVAALGRPTSTLRSNQGKL